ncbi:hypothetical protein FB45DRAFT_862139 [Roridomyces roridus]|uniref:Uncharacterized protein n=1 Tax=Roridomyces roridus TaxID=1738132 RepID=A0AAD7CCC7_9AGAR|nr:hypothetical protein FB45DRAFT_862139 [Roridomyces roridus]
MTGARIERDNTGAISTTRAIEVDVETLLSRGRSANASKEEKRVPSRPVMLTTGGVCTSVFGERRTAEFWASASPGAKFTFELFASFNGVHGDRAERAVPSFPTQINGEDWPESKPSPSPLELLMAGRQIFKRLEEEVAFEYESQENKRIGHKAMSGGLSESSRTRKRAFTQTAQWRQRSRVVSAFLGSGELRLEETTLARETGAEFRLDSEEFGRSGRFEASWSAVDRSKPDSSSAK